MNIPNYVVWVGGVEVVDSYVSKEKAEEIAEQYREDGYDDVQISQSFHESSII
jgi:hypothetical protein